MIHQLPLQTPQRDPTPDAQSGETSAAADPVAMEAEVLAQHAAVKSLTEANPPGETPTAVEMQDAQVKAMDSPEPAQETDEVTEKSEKLEEPDTIVEEIFEKKVVSLDTRRDEEGGGLPVEEQMDVEDGVEDEMEVDAADAIEGDASDAIEDDEDEAPKKKAKVFIEKYCDS